MPDEAPPTTARLWLRAIVLVVVGVWLTVGPMVRGPLKQTHMVWLPRWEMFGGWGKDICAVEYFKAEPDGTQTPIDWVTANGKTRDTLKDRKRNRITTVDQAFRLGVRLCGLDSDPDPTIHVRMKCGTSNRWKFMRTSEINLCSAAARASYRRRG